MAQKRFAWLSALVAVLVLVGLASPGSLAGTAPTEIEEAAVIRLYYSDRAHLDAVVGELDVWEVHGDEGYVVAAVQPATYQWLRGLGYRLEIDVEKTALLGIQAPLDARFHYFDDYYPNTNGRYIVDFLQDINTAYPNLTELVDVGDAWLANQPGEHPRDIWVLRITNEDPAYGPIEDKPAFFLFGGIHAREVAIPELVIRYIRYLTEGYQFQGGYGLNADVTWLVNHNVLYALVSQNPDGHWVDEMDTGAYRRKNMDDDDGCSDPSSWGVDLNRNHSFFWGCCGGSSGSPCSETYRGPSAGSEPETQAFQTYFASVMRDQNGPNDDNTIGFTSPLTTTGIFLSLHSYQDEVLWPWDLPQPPPNEAGLQTIGRKLGYFTGYNPTGSIGYTVDGPTDDWTYGKFGIPSFTFEVGPTYGTCYGFFPPYGCIDGIDGMPRNFWNENRPAFLYLHKIASTPYMTAYGPDASNVAATPDPAVVGEVVDLTATIADHRYGGDPLQPIYGAEYFIDAPGEDGSGIPMFASDGGWGELSEDVEAIIDTASLPLSKHYLLVHGLNDDGDWGPFTAVFLTVASEATPPDAAFYHSGPVCQGGAISFTNTTVGSPPITYTWSFGDGASSHEENPTHVYADWGEFGVTLTATNPVDSDVATGTVEILPVAIASFTYSPTQPQPNEWVQFTDTSIGDPDSWEWYFGDGAMSPNQNPAHRYLHTGTFTITLVVENICGQSEIYSQTLTVAEPPPQMQRYYLPLIIKGP